MSILHTDLVSPDNVRLKLAELILKLLETPERPSVVLEKLAAETADTGVTLSDIRFASWELIDQGKIRLTSKRMLERV